MKTLIKSTWKIDPGHSSIQFKVKHMAIANVSGNFNTFEGQVERAETDFEGASVYVKIDAGSINTNNLQRDEHLKSDLFFNVSAFPEIFFKGKMPKVAADFDLQGELILHGVSRIIVLEVVYTGTEKDKFGQTRAAFELSGKINRKDFGLSWNLLTEAGGLMVGEEIKLQMDIQLIQLTS